MQIHVVKSKIHRTVFIIFFYFSGHECVAVTNEVQHGENDYGYVMYARDCQESVNYFLCSADTNSCENGGK